MKNYWWLVVIIFFLSMCGGNAYGDESGDPHNPIVGLAEKKLFLKRIFQSF